RARAGALPAAGRHLLHAAFPQHARHGARERGGRHRGRHPFLRWLGLGPRRLSVRARCHGQHLHRGHGEHARGHGLRHARRPREAAGGRAAHPRDRRARRARPGDEGRPDARAARSSRAPANVGAARSSRAPRANRPSCTNPRRKTMKRFLHALLALALGATFAAASLAQAPEKKSITIAVGGKSLFYYLPLSVAERKGYFKDEGLEVEIPDFPGGAKALQALVGGSADLVSGAYEHTINMAAKHQPIEAVVLQLHYNAIELLMPDERAAKYRDGRDLKGLKIGVTAPGSSTNMFVDLLLVKAGLEPSDVSIVGVGAGAVAAMEKGEIDALANLDPVITQLEATGKFRSVVDTRTEKGMEEVYGKEYMAAVIYTTDEFVKKYPNTVQAVVNAMVRADRWIAKASPQEIVDLMPDSFKAGNPALYKQGLEKNLAGYSKDGLMSLAAARNVYKVLDQFEPSVMKAGKIDLSKTFDNRFAQKADSKYK